MVILTKFYNNWVKFSDCLFSKFLAQGSISLTSTNVLLCTISKILVHVTTRSLRKSFPFVIIRGPFVNPLRPTSLTTWYMDDSRLKIDSQHNKNTESSNSKIRTRIYINKNCKEIWRKQNHQIIVHVHNKLENMIPTTADSKPKN